MRLDADDWLDESALLVLVSKIKGNPDAGLVFGNYFYTDEAGGILGAELRDIYDESTSSHFTPAHGACSLISLRALKSIGGYSTDINAQDGWDLWFRIKDRFKIHQIHTPIFYYRQHSSSLSTDNSRLLKARNTIFSKLRTSRSGDYSPSCVAIIPAKQNYKHWLNAPMSILQGKSLLEHTIMSAVNSSCISFIVITSESQAVIDFAKTVCANYNANFLFHIRTPQSHVDPTAIIYSCLQYLDTINYPQPDLTFFLSIHSPYRSSYLIDCSFNQLLHDSADSLLTVSQQVEPVLQKQHNQLFLLNPGRFIGLAHDSQSFYMFNGGIIAVWTPSDIYNSKSSLVELLGNHIAYIETTPEQSIQVKSISDLDNQNLISSMLS
jgi:CMP-N-acetylneuraminic acid synthetase